MQQRPIDASCDESAPPPSPRGRPSRHERRCRPRLRGVEGTSNDTPTHRRHALGARARRSAARTPSCHTRRGGRPRGAAWRCACSYPASGRARAVGQRVARLLVGDHRGGAGGDDQPARCSAPPPPRVRQPDPKRTRTERAPQQDEGAGSLRVGRALINGVRHRRDPARAHAGRDGAPRRRAPDRHRDHRAAADGRGLVPADHLRLPPGRRRVLRRE